MVDLKPLYYRDGYKAVVEKPWDCPSLIRLREPAYGYRYTIFCDGRILADKGYAWDFATGAFDTDSIKRASLAHDIICQAINEGKISRKWQRTGDNLLRDACLAGKMWSVRAWWVYNAVRLYQKHKKTLTEQHPVKCVGEEWISNEGCA